MKQSFERPVGRRPYVQTLLRQVGTGEAALTWLVHLGENTQGRPSQAKHTSVCREVGTAVGASTDDWRLFWSQCCKKTKIWLNNSLTAMETFPPGMNTTRLVKIKTGLYPIINPPPDGSGVQWTTLGGKDVHDSFMWHPTKYLNNNQRVSQAPRGFISANQLCSFTHLPTQI